MFFRAGDKVVDVLKQVGVSVKMFVFDMDPSALLLQLIHWDNTRNHSLRASAVVVERNSITNINVGRRERIKKRSVLMARLCGVDYAA